VIANHLSSAPSLFKHSPRGETANAVDYTHIAETGCSKRMIGFQLHTIGLGVLQAPQYLPMFIKPTVLATRRSSQVWIAVLKLEGSCTRTTAERFRQHLQRSNWTLLDFMFVFVSWLDSPRIITRLVGCTVIVTLEWLRNGPFIAVRCSRID
jgi:hypothetical protein